MFRTRAFELARRISGRPEARERRGRVVGTLAVEQHRSVERPVIVEVADLRLQIGIELVARTPEQRCARDGALIAGLIVAVDVLRPAIHLAVIDGETPTQRIGDRRSEEHTSELQSLMRISYAVFCLK